ncbi:hypothetical protein Btru_061074 [Bulinus truncatus]|nr:hypothetical protein Btru_061074 [Bulinus truncatus]
MMKENLTFPANVSEETHHALENNCFKDDNFKDYNFKDAERFMHNNTEVDGAPYYICEDTNTEMDVTPFSAREATLNTKPSSYNSYPDISKKLTDPILEKKIPDESFEENEIFFVSEIQQLDLNDIRNEKFSQVETKFESGSGTSTYTREIGNRTSTYTKEWIDDSVTVDDPVKECTASRPSSSSGYSSLDSESSYEREPKQIDRYELSVNKYDFETNLGCAGTTANAHSDEPSPRKYLETLVHNIQVPAVSATVCAVSAEQSHVIGVVSQDDPVKECTASRPSSSSGYSSLDSESSYEREPKQIDRYELSVNKYDYTAEFIISDLHYQQININSASDINQCLRNPNHLNFIDLHSLNLESLPKKLRCQGIGRMLELISLLTVKVSWKKYNDGRGLLAISTGSVFDCEIQPISLCGHVYIKTSVNHINSDTEAKHCLVEFFSGSSLSAKRLKGEAIERMPGDSKVYLKCPTFDLNFIKYIKMIQTELRDMVQMLPTQVKRVLTTKVLMVSLLHGGHKVISYGSSTVLKYQLVEYQDESDGQTRFRLEKVTDIVKGVKNKHLVRKMLLYSADACPGSCGAPVVRFRSVTTDCADNVTYQLDTWMHHGYHKDEDLNVSYVKECTEEDFYDWDWVQKANRGQDDPLIISVTQSIPQQLYNPEASHPYNNQTTELSQPPPATFSFIEHPSYPAYITIQQRLLSYSNWISNNIHKPTQLAEAGFFYAGYSDCVRCFCCGLGLRSWKPGDDIYVEHERYRPTCSFLRQHLLSNASLWQQRDHMTRLDVSHVETNLGCAGTTANAHSEEASPRKYLETLVHNIQVPAVSATVCAVSADQSHVIGVVSQDGGLQTRRNAPSDATATITSSQYDSTVSSQLADTGLNQNVSREDLNVTLNLLKQENEALQGMTKCKRCQIGRKCGSDTLDTCVILRILCRYV